MLDPELPLLESFRPYEGWRGIAGIGEQVGATALEKVYKEHRATSSVSCIAPCNFVPSIVFLWVNVFSLCVIVDWGTSIQRNYLRMLKRSRTAKVS